MVDVYTALTDFARQKFINAGLSEDKVVVKPNFVHPDPRIGQGDVLKETGFLHGVGYYASRFYLVQSVSWGAGQTHNAFVEVPWQQVL